MSSNTPKKSKKDRAETPDFEQSLADLETLIEQMEQGDLTLDQSLKHFERGIALTKACQTALNEAQLTVEKLLNDGQLESFDSEE